MTSQAPFNLSCAHDQKPTKRGLIAKFSLAMGLGLTLLSSPLQAAPEKVKVTGYSVFATWYEEDSCNFSNVTLHAGRGTRATSSDPEELFLVSFLSIVKSNSCTETSMVFFGLNDTNVVSGRNTVSAAYNGTIEVSGCIYDPTNGSICSLKNANVDIRWAGNHDATRTSNSESVFTPDRKLIIRSKGTGATAVANGSIILDGLTEVIAGNSYDGNINSSSTVELTILGK